MLNRSGFRPAAANVCVNRRDSRRGLATLSESDPCTIMKNAAILVVDGNTSERASLVESLRDAGYSAVGAETFETARRLLHAQSYDLLITDLRLAAYNGLHLVFHSRVLNPGALAIVLSPMPDVSLENETRCLGAHFVAGPVELKRMLTLVGLVLEGVQQQPASASETTA
jgi:two-component system, NtrC family, C4-dicarboxylate transport response regulator DctD